MKQKQINFQREKTNIRCKLYMQGTVLNIVSGGRDYEVTVEFDSAGVKKMFAAFAKLRKI